MVTWFRILLLQYEVQVKVVLAFQALEVAFIQL